eukprot:CAMPEP_0176339168 /NCGR_PEP_ID=MMETSP0126-20121128/552_1 /TAXON_ID=141414 ORGANISM="Strombidinopsis acuminatum, Strain SPMC142" /NCGR_SAMPLE_ID=MMETSP0126 /ASSEMBLY_ACC=CAM_ASM_000229 /LENGTH=35 /DNA_ID= /DNA_START= /DNA_END= /DNA_ORIENTATION=
MHYEAEMKNRSGGEEEYDEEEEGAADVEQHQVIAN